MNKETLAEQYCESHNLNILKPIVNAAYIDGYKAGVEACQEIIEEFQKEDCEDDQYTGLVAAIGLLRYLNAE